MSDSFEDLSTLREDIHLEAKSAQGGFPKSFWESYAAMANTDGGTILLGIAERRAGQPPLESAQRALGCGSTKAKRLLSVLVAKGAVETTGSGNRTAYQLPTQQTT